MTMIEGIDTVNVSDNALRRTATQLKDNCEVKGWVDKLPRMPSMAAFLSVTLRLGGGTSIIVQHYDENIEECELRINDLLERVFSEQYIASLPSYKRITDITNALREQE